MVTRFLPRTLRTRLTALIILSTSVILALSGVALYQALWSRINAASAEQMDSTMAALRTHLTGVQSTGDVARHAEMWNDQLHGHPSMDLAIFDLAGNRLFGTGGFQTYAPLLTAQAGHMPIAVVPTHSRLRYLVMVVPLERATGPSVRVAVQYDGTRDAVLLRTYASTIILIEVFGVVLAAAFAYGIAMLGLSPLRRLIARAEEMSSSRLAHRLPELDTSGELKDLEHAFNGMLQRLHESFMRLGQFSSNLAHDMRTPLTNLQAAAQVALAQPRSAEEYRNVIESSIDEYQRLSRMIEDMLFLARADNADSVIAINNLDAVAEAKRVAGYYESMAEEAGVAIRVDGHAEVHADLLLYQRVLSNLLSNALAHAPRGSDISVNCSESGALSTITVSDRGAGIHAQHLGRVFERFYRVDPSRHNSASGIGLGLSIVKSIMDTHGGQCGVESVPGVRTTFWLRFPRRVIPGAVARAGHS